MNIDNALKLLREVKDVSFATVDENGNPQVRIIDVMHIEDRKIYFLTARGKHFFEELSSLSKIAVACMTKNYEMIRINGNIKTIERENQKNWIDKIFEYNPSMKDIYSEKARYILDVFYIEDYALEYFDITAHPIFRETYINGNYKINKKGFYINDNCKICGKCRCAEVCPQKAILKKDIYYIEEEHCLHCGLCYETCRQNAIGRY